MTERLTDEELMEIEQHNRTVAHSISSVLRLVAEIRSLRAENEGMRQAVQMQNERVDHLLAELDESRGNLATRSPHSKCTCPWCLGKLTP